MQHILEHCRLATPADQHLRSYDHTKISAVFTCPTWGVVRYGLHKVMSASSRAMALEAGQAMHQVFAAVRLYDWARQVVPNAIPLPIVEAHFKQIFPRGDWEAFQQALSDNSVEARGRFALQTLHESGFVDDESDRRRTVAALSDATLIYNLRWDEPGPGRHPIYYNPKTAFLGIEVPFDIVIEFGNVKPFRFVGRIDGVHVGRNGSLLIKENKTGGRIDNVWAAAFATSHQVTGYAFATSVVTGLPCYSGEAVGTQIPPPKNLEAGGIMAEPFTRSDYQFERWFEWLLTGVSMYDTYLDDPTKAPQFTHSCNRYFRACSLIPFCASPREDQLEMLEMMGEEVWSPLRGEGSSE